MKRSKVLQDGLQQSTEDTYHIHNKLYGAAENRIVYEQSKNTTAAIKSLLTPCCIAVTGSTTLHPQMHLPFNLTYCWGLHNQV